MPGIPELLVILVILIVVFGAGRLSDVGGALGRSVREFRKATTDDPPAVPAAAPPPSAVITQPAPTAVLVENRCPSCATVNPIGQGFCGQCGTRLTRAA